MNICMVGTGYVGLVSGACFAEVGHNVSCVDIDRGVIEGLRSGAVHVFEPGLGELVRRNVSDGRLIFTCDISEGLRDAEICFVAVGTPSGDNGETELRFVYSAAGEIASAADRDCLVAVKSTAPVGTCGVVQDMISAGLGAARRSDISIEVASNPEFLKEGSAVSDFLNPDRVVAGVSSERARVLMETLYSSFVPPERIIFMDIASAEITKYACNAMLAARISFINEIALLCDVAGADVTNVRAGMALDPRIGGQFLNAGCGYGGSCFPKDIQALDQTGRGLGLEMKMASATSLVNERQKRVLGGMVVERFGKNLKGLCIAVLGLAFKPNTDDMRYAPSIPLVRTLATLGADVVAVDPAACDRARDLLPQGVRFADTAEMALRGADAAILVTEWADFRSLDWRDCGSRMRRRILFDGRNIFDPSSIRALGFEYYCIGRGCVVGGANGGRSRQRDAGRA